MSTPGCVITPEASPTLDLFSVAPDPDSNYNANESGEDFRATSCRQSTDIQDAAWADDNLAYCEFAQYSPMAQTPLTPTDLNPWDHIDFSHTFLQDFDISTVLEKTPVPQAEEGKRNMPLQLELSVLLGEMQNNLQMLKAYYTSEDLSLEDALNNYPIGETLYLLRRFCDLQGHAWETDELLTWLQGTDSSDMVESLILVTCYVMMLRILDTLFDHLEKYLARITSATGPCNTSRGLKLRELTATTAMCARAREAFNTLKNALKSMNLPKRESHESIAVVSEIGEMFDCREIDTSEDRSTMRMVKENTVCSTIYSERDILCMKMMRLEQQLDHCCPADRRTLDV
ncbi:hypothetical protein F5Y08DRAFT_345502 [Xylaria arbuscula]|nr:hypothetical protein F5Y08DRAFT_345502 [Xylaria arbuscula]